MRNCQCRNKTDSTKVSYVLRETFAESYLAESPSGTFRLDDKRAAARFKTKMDAERALSRALLNGLDLNYIILISRGDILRFKIVKLVKK